MLALEEGKKVVQKLKQLGYNQATILKGSNLSQLFYESKIINKSSIRFMDQYNEFIRMGILVSVDEKIYSTIRVVPFDNYYFIVDSPLLASTGGIDKYYSNRDNLYGYIGADGMRLTNYIYPQIPRQLNGRCLDLCAGSGLIGIALSSLFSHMYGVDVDESAVDWMRFNAELNGINNHVSYCGDLYEPVESLGPFDVIVANPSYSFFPPEIIEKYQIKRHEIADEFGTELVINIIDGFEGNLAQSGVGYICTTAPTINGKDYIYHRILEKYSRFNYAIEIYYMFQYMHSDFRKYYYDNGITRFSFIFIKVQKGHTFSIKKSYSKYYYLSQIPMYIRFPYNVMRNFRKIFSRLFV